MDNKLTVEDKFELIKRNTEEILGEEDLKKLLNQNKKPVAYIGTAPTGRPHIGYFLWGLKVADLLKAGFKVKILLADLHAALDNVSWDILDKRYDYYKKIIPLMLKSIGADIKNLEFVKGSDFQSKEDYMFDVLKMSSFVSVRDANRAASEIVKQGKSPKLSGLIYPIMQALDEQYLGVDVQLGGTDQRKIFVLARENNPKLGYKSRIEIMHALIPGLIEGGKMSSSNNESKIDFLDDEKTVEKKINKAYCSEGDVNNGLLPFLKHIVMMIKKDKNEKFIIERPEKYGGNSEYLNYSEIQRDFISKKLHPLDLKKAVAKEINFLLKEIRKNKEILEKLSKKAYD